MNYKRNGRKVFALLVIAGILLIAGCGNDSKEISKAASLGDGKKQIAKPDPSEEAEEAYPYLYPVIEERNTILGEMQSYLTGEWIAQEIAERRPIAVAIPNQKSCFPHYGIGNAGIIYQVPIRDNLTRLVVLIEDFDELDRIGPVRSIRDYMVYIGLEHDAIVCHWGTAFYANALLNSDLVDNISQGTTGIEVPVSSAFGRYHRPGKNETDSAYLFVDGLMKGVEKRGYSWEYHDSFEPKFLFAKEGIRAGYEDAQDATQIRPGIKGNYDTVKAYFEYNEDTGLYDYYEYGSPFIDERTGKQLSFSNVVLQVCYAEERDAKGYLIVEMHGPVTGDGELYFFTNGKVVEGTWERMGGDQKPAKYYDQDGNELVFNQGKTFVCVIWDKWADYIEFE